MRSTYRLFALILLCLLPRLALAADAPPLSFGVLNQQSPQTTAARWNPILKYVADKTGVELRLRMGPTVQDTDAMMARGEFDFMFTNHNFQREYDGLGYRVIARWGGEPVRCVFVALPDSEIRKLADLHGRRLAYPSPDAFLGYAVPRVILEQEDVREIPVFAGNQDAALSQLRFRRVHAAALNSRFLREYEQKHGVSFRVLHESEPYPDLAVIVHPRVPAALVERVRAALVGMSQDPAAAPILARAGSPGFAPAGERDYEGVRRIYRALRQ